jgi:hypothetical protein
MLLAARMFSDVMCFVVVVVIVVIVVVAYFYCFYFIFLFKLQFHPFPPNVRYVAFAKYGEAHAASSVAVGRGLYAARATFPSYFTFQARDVFGNDLEANSGGKNNMM